ncbi:molybdopterin-dependent oxidoreductase [Halobacillus salinarum]|uniref:Molybdopterin-dependent oxidoreductase n=1 Tax=Halobacillus salinarum TaxID=2932257 RepID=A0ABY4EJ20_9BACI|nr:molybdopterin-dependent oxidoreductase [Halobacillus salinarum]UOQ44485.1 molybdopterin-dependent oxidoreductase [Halobacillus salinarum]
MPEISDKNFSFKIDGLVNNPKSWNWEQFVQMNREVQVSDFHCVTGWSLYHVTWEGIKLKKLLASAGVQDKAKYVKFYSQDGVYTDTLTIKQAMEDDVMVAVLIDGELIENRNGGPVRLIVPEMYAYKSVKWLNRMELIEEEHIGYWEQRGYKKDAYVDV